MTAITVSPAPHSVTLTINGTNKTIVPVEYKGRRVITLAMMDEVHQRPDGTASRNFREHRQRFIESEDYFEVTADEIRRQSLGRVFPPRTTKGILLTESGYLLLVKSFTDELAWSVQRQLVNAYFRVQGHDAGLNAEEPLTPSEQQTLKEIVQRKVASEISDGSLRGKAFAEVWSRLHNKFRVASYHQLPRHRLAEAILYVTQLQLGASKPSAAPDEVLEQVSDEDMRNLTRMVWLISDRMPHQAAWRHAIWKSIRASTNTSAPKRYLVRDLPIIADELKRILAVATAFSKAIHDAERVVIRRAVRGREDMEPIIEQVRARVEQVISASDDELQRLLMPWHVRELNHVIERKPCVSYGTYLEPFSEKIAQD